MKNYRQKFQRPVSIYGYWLKWNKSQQNGFEIHDQIQWALRQLLKRSFNPCDILMEEGEEKNEFIEEFRKYLQIDTRQPNPDYSSAIKFLKAKCESLGLTCLVKEYVAGKPTLIATLKGGDKQGKSILLNSHVDVVPTVCQQWDVPPMSATIKDGKIYARGAQDMKCVGMAYIHALQNLIHEKVDLKKIIHLSFVPDEEVGGMDGMKRLVDDSELWSRLNVGVVLDEGVPSPTDKYLVFNRERSVLWLQATISGSAGHGSLLIGGTAVESLTTFLHKINQFRESQRGELIKERGRLGNVTSINVTNVKSNSTQVNVLPSKFFVDIDVRIGPNFESEEAFIKFFKDSCLSENISYEIIQRTDVLNDVSQDPQYIEIIEDTLREEGFEFAIFPGSTDSKYIRAKGVNAYGISLFRNTPILAHDHNEFLGIEEYLRGVKMYEKLIRNLSNN